MRRKTRKIISVLMIMLMIMPFTWQVFADEPLPEDQETPDVQSENMQPEPPAAEAGTAVNLKYLKYLWLQDLLSRQLRKLLKCLKRANPQNRMQLPQRKLLISLSLNTQMRSQATLSL